MDSWLHLIAVLMGKPDNAKGHRAVTFGFHLEISCGHGSGAPPCYLPGLL